MQLLLLHTVETLCDSRTACTAHNPPPALTPYALLLKQPPIMPHTPMEDTAKQIARDSTCCQNLGFRNPGDHTPEPQRL